VEYATWAGRYRAIQQEFGFSLDREERAADLLERQLRPRDREAPLARLRARINGRDAIVVGRAPGAGPPPVWRLPAHTPAPVLIAADGAAADCLAAGLVPSLIVSDLDGPVESEVAANGRGSLVVIHAHGDNVPALERWVPEFPGELAGSWAGPPRPALINVGGFTDGDRSAFLAEAMGARSIRLWGFDFERVRETDPERQERKRAKLRWARTLLSELASSSAVPLLLWRRDGTTVDYATEYSTSTR
jgi:hypothetical protein